MPSRTVVLIRESAGGVSLECISSDREEEEDAVPSLSPPDLWQSGWRGWMNEWRGRDAGGRGIGWTVLQSSFLSFFPHLSVRVSLASLTAFAASLLPIPSLLSCPSLLEDETFLKPFFALSFLLSSFLLETCEQIALSLDGSARRGRSVSNGFEGRKSRR